MFFRYDRYNEWGGGVMSTFQPPAAPPPPPRRELVVFCHEKSGEGPESPEKHEKYEKYPDTYRTNLKLTLTSTALDFMQPQPFLFFLSLSFLVLFKL